MTCMPIVAFQDFFAITLYKKHWQLFCGAYIAVYPGTLCLTCMLIKHYVYSMCVIIFFFNETDKPRNYVPFEASASHLRERPYLLPLTLTCSLGVRR